MLRAQTPGEVWLLFQPPWEGFGAGGDPSRTKAAASEEIPARGGSWSQASSSPSPSGDTALAAPLCHPSCSPDPKRGPAPPSYPLGSGVHHPRTSPSLPIPLPRAAGMGGDSSTRGLTPPRGGLCDPLGAPTMGKLRQGLPGTAQGGTLPPKSASRGPLPATSESRLGDAVGSAAEAGDGAELELQSHGVRSGETRGDVRGDARGDVGGDVRGDVRGSPPGDAPGDARGAERCARRCAGLCAVPCAVLGAVRCPLSLPSAELISLFSSGPACTPLPGAGGG